MGAEHSQQRSDSDGREIFEGELKLSSSAAAAASHATAKRKGMLRHQSSSAKNSITGASSPTTGDLSRASSPPLSVCSDLPYVSYTANPIGDSPKIRNKSNLSTLRAAQMSSRNSHPSGAKPKRPQSTASNHSIVIVKPGSCNTDNDMDPELAQLLSIPQFLPVLRESISSATLARDPEILERIPSQHLHNICSRMQTHLNACATQISADQSVLVERTKVVSNSLTTLFASFVDMQKTYASYAEHFTKVRGISQQLSRCKSLLDQNIASLEAINSYLDVEDQLEPFVWCNNAKKQRGEAEGAACEVAGRLRRL